MLKKGLYEQVVNKEIEEELHDLPDAVKHVEKIDTAEASSVLTQYLSEVVHKGLDRMARDDISAQIELANKIVKLISQETAEEDLQELTVADEGEQLLALISEDDPLVRLGQKKAKDIPRPETSAAHSSLFTGAIHEPQMFSELKKEIATADRIDMLVSFVKWSGLRLLIESLRAFTDRGGQLRVITTTYMGATDVKAVEELRKLKNTEIRVSYDTERTRLHAKAYMFYRESGFTTAYVGSSNLSNPAMSSGLEWNVKLTTKDMLPTIQKMEATFDSYWHTAGFEIYEENSKTRLERALTIDGRANLTSDEPFVFDIQPYPYQQEILDRLQAEREVRGYHRNLVVAATGTGKTLISAFDYRRFCQTTTGMRPRLLFVVHREEILKQSRSVFRGGLKDPNFGELFVGNYKPESLDYLFVSIQTLASQRLYDILPKDYYDFIIVDEFHHAAAPTYRGLLNHFEPKILLGLTATPERMDGKSVLDYFGGRMASEIRLPEAIERKLLCPFQYFGVSDDVDLSEIRWTRGGYDKKELSHIFSMNRAIAEKRAGHIVNSLRHYVADVNKVRGLGFCVSIEHAKFMEEYFLSKGIPCLSLTAASGDAERNEAKRRLVAGEIKFIFVVDLYNEGIDIPEVDTILFLRPTESLTVFLQQLGRGLRLSEGKECLTVLDFIGRANKRYNFEEKFAALLSHSRHSMSYEVKKGFVSLPKGCYIQLEKKASKVILENIRRTFGDKAGLLSRIETFTEDSGLPLTMKNFVSYYHLEAKAIYGKYSFSRLCVEAGAREDFSEPAETVITKAFGKFVAVDSRRWIRFLVDKLTGILASFIHGEAVVLTELERRMFQMFYMTVFQKAADFASEETRENMRSLVESPTMMRELRELMEWNLECIDFIDRPVDLGFDCPLDLHCTYTRDQILVAMDYMTPGNVREGVKWLPDKKVDVFFVTLNKSDKDYSPTTMYNDYSINESLFHWQSQSTTAESSATGLRYINHRKQGSK
ncbi:MAG: DUF3427 domain-containing protein, partial [Lachnospiraceae bacterium]|nr:DUF3427 domain-containing protein [Lachnospiraceae bacterium]